MTTKTKTHTAATAILRVVEDGLRVARIYAAKHPDDGEAQFGAALLAAVAKDCRLAARGRVRVIDGKGRVSTLRVA